MKLKQLLLVSSLLTATAVWADAPATAIISGAALNEDAPAELTHISANVFETFAELLPGGELEVKDGNGAALNLNGAKSVDAKGVYQITADFGDNSLKLRRVVFAGLQHCWSGTKFGLTYAGKGVYKGAFRWNDITNNPGENRYQLAIRYTRDNDNTYKYGPVNTANDATPDGTEEYFHMLYAPNANQWDPKWKIESKYMNNDYHMLTISFRGKAYTHSFGEIEATIPSSLKLQGSAFDEGYSRDFAKVEGTKYEIFTRLKPGALNIIDGDGNRYVIKNNEIVEEQGSTPFDKTGVFCINIDFASGVATIQEVNSVKYYHLMSFGPQGESLAYQSYGVWTGEVPVNTGDDRYRIEMYLDGSYQTWGAVTSTDQKPSQANIGDSYYLLKRVPWTFWGDAFKVEDSQMGKTLPMTVYLNANKYSHSFEAPVMTGIEDVVTDEDAPAVYYNLQGVRVDNPANGLYIKKQGNKTTKVLVK